MSELGKVKEDERLGIDIMDLYHYRPCKADSGGLGSDTLPLQCQKGMHASAADIINRSSVAEAGTLLLCGDGDTHAANNNRRNEGNLVRKASALGAW